MSFIYCHLNFHANLLRPWRFPLSNNHSVSHSLTVTTELHVIYCYFRVEPGKEPAVLSNVWCTGTETSLLGCTSYGWRYVNQQTVETM